MIKAVSERATLEGIIRLRRPRFTRTRPSFQVIVACNLVLVNYTLRLVRGSYVSSKQRSLANTSCDSWIVACPLRHPGVRRFQETLEGRPRRGLNEQGDVTEIDSDSAGRVATLMRYGKQKFCVRRRAPAKKLPELPELPA